MSSNLFFAFLFAFGVFLMFASFRLPRTLGQRVVDRAAEEGPRMATFAEASLLQAMLADLSRKIAPERPTLVEQLRQSGWVFQPGRVSFPAHGRCDSLPDRGVNGGPGPAAVF